MEIHISEQKHYPNLELNSKRLVQLKRLKNHVRIDALRRNIEDLDAHYETKLDFNGSQWVEIFDPQGKHFIIGTNYIEVQWEKPIPLFKQ